MTSSPFHVGPRYIPKRVIGNGGYGVVINAMDTITNELVAIKQLKIHESDQCINEHLRQTIREIRILKQLKHQNILEIKIKNDYDCSKKLLKMVDTADGHYGIVLETKKNKKNAEVMLVEDDTRILFVEDARIEFGSFKAIKKVHEINCHKGKDQLISAFRNAGWMSPNVVNMIDCVVNDC